MANVSKHEDVRMSGQEANISDVAQECDEDEGKHEERDPESNWQHSGVEESSAIATEKLLWGEMNTGQIVPICLPIKCLVGLIYNKRPCSLKRHL